MRTLKSAFVVAVLLVAVSCGSTESSRIETTPTSVLGASETDGTMAGNGGATSSAVSRISAVPLMTGPFGALLGPGGGVGTLVIDADAGCVYIDGIIPAGERHFVEWFVGTTATAEGVTTYLGDFIPNGGPIQWYGFSVPVVSDDPRVDVSKTTPPEFHHCLDHATHFAGRGPVRPGCPTCTVPRPWPSSVPSAYNSPTCEPPTC